MQKRTKGLACTECGMGMQRLYIYMGASKKQRTLGIGLVCRSIET